MPRKKKMLSDEVPKENKKNGPEAGIKEKLDETDEAKTWEPNETDRKLVGYINRRIGEMKDFRKGLKIEKIWKEADEEYVPHELELGTTRKRFETDQDTGLRSRMVKVGDDTQQWRQNSSAPTLLEKIQTAISIIVDNQPEANLVALEKKFEKTTDLAYSLWKRNWQITNAKEKLKLFIFDLIKYGWATQRTYPRVVKYNKSVLIESDLDNPENNKYENNELIWFNDVDRDNLDPFRTWIDELTKPYDPYSMNECYYEIDYSYDGAKAEFEQYTNWKFVPRDAVVSVDDKKVDAGEEGLKQRKDIVTIGFFESRLKDIFIIWLPKNKLILSQSPLPNDDGMLSITHAPYILRSSKSPYGISLWQIIKQNKSLYDKMKNMTMDQLVLSIMKFGFFSGTSVNLGDGKMEIVPGQARQLTSSTGKPEVNWMEIPGPGQEAWKGLEVIEAMMDSESGISPTLEGEVTGKTLGEILHAKESSLKRLKVPVENIAWAIEQDAYLTLSWMSQVYSIPTVKEFASEKELFEYEKENEITHWELFKKDDEKADIMATYLPQLSLHLEDNKGELTKSKESKFFQVGKDIKPSQMKWRGLFKVIPRSIIDKSQELIKASKTELFNMLAPLLQFPPELYANAVKQILKLHEEDEKDWLPDSWVQYLEKGPNLMAGQMGGGPIAPGANSGQPGGNTMQNGAGMGGMEAQKVVPGNQVSGAPQLQAGGVFSKKM